MKKHIDNKDTSKVSQLIDYIKKSKYIDIQDHASVCQSFDVPYRKKIFREIYRKRFYDYLQNDITTVETVSRKTGIPVKYLTCCKLHYQKRKLLEVIYKGKCPTTGSNNVQFITTNKEFFNHG